MYCAGFLKCLARQRAIRSHSAYQAEKTQDHYDYCGKMLKSIIIIAFKYFDPIKSSCFYTVNNYPSLVKDIFQMVTELWSCNL